MQAGEAAEREERLTTGPERCRNPWAQSVVAILNIMLQAIVSKGIAAGRASSTAVNGRLGGVNKVTNAKPFVSGRAVTPSVRVQSQLTRQAVARYTSKPATNAGDEEQVWEDLDGVNDFYDPRWDTDYPEEEGASGVSSLCCCVSSSLRFHCSE